MQQLMPERVCMITRIHIGKLTKTLLALTALSISLSACQDKDKISSASQLSTDGQSVAQQYSKYMNSAADALEQQCDLENFSTLLALRAAKSSVQSYLSQAPKCAQDPNRISAVKKLRDWAKDGEAVGNAYAALSKITGSDQTATVQTSIDNLTGDLEKAANRSASDSVKSAISKVSTFVVQHRQAMGIEEFAQTVAAVPLELAAPLKNEAKTLDKAFEVYDKDRQSAIYDSYVRQVADPGPLLTGFYGKLGVNGIVDARQDSYLAAFAGTIGAEAAAPQASDARQQLSVALQKLADQTKKVSATTGYLSTIESEIPDAKEDISKVESILHPNQAKAKN